MSELDWDTLLAIDGQQEEELERFRAAQGLKPLFSERTESNKKERGVQSNISLAPGTGFGRKNDEPEKRAQSAGAKAGKWEAETLILDEEEETVDDTDLLLYQVRKKYTGIEHDDTFEEMLRSVPAPIPEWSMDAAHQSVYQKYLSISQLLSKGQITDSAQREMILLSGTGEDMDPGMKQFYSLFTLLQSNPSRDHIANVLKKAGSCLAGGESTRAPRVLVDAILEAVRKQDAADAAQDKRYRSRQARYDSARSRAQSDYDSAKKEADRWRRGNE